MNRHDIIVAGFGTAGSIAAIAAARSGARVLVLERNTYPGGTHTGGFIPGYYRQPPEGLQAEIDADVARRHAAGGWHPGNTELRKCVLEEEALKAGVELHYAVTIINVNMTGKRVAGLRWLDAEGQPHESSARIVIDATADAEICRMAGCELVSGRASDGQFQPFTNTMGCLSAQTIHAANFDAGRIDQTREPGYSQMLLQSALVHLHDDYAQHRELFAPADLPGIREGVHIVSVRQLTLAEFLNGNAVLPEPVAYPHSNIDTHANDLALESETLQEWLIGCSMWGIELDFAVPRATLIPRGVRGLIAAARHLGVDHDIGHALRMNSCMGRIGEAAGIMAALAVQRNIEPLEVPYDLLAARLHLSPSPLRNNERIWGLAPAEIHSELGTDHPGCALWSARCQLDVTTLRGWLDTAPTDSNLKRHIAFALALKRDPAALPELRRMVAERDPFRPTHSRKYNHARGYAALFFLGCFADPETLPLAAGVLADRTIDCLYEYHTHAVMALLKIGRRHPGLRPEIAARLRSNAEDPQWRLEARLKGTRQTMRRMDFSFRVAIAEELTTWGIAHRIGSVLPLVAADAFDLNFARNRGVLDA